MHRARRSLAAAAAAASVLAAAGLLVLPQPAAAAQQPASAGPKSRPTALDEARRTGRSVVVEAEGDANEAVLANPDGSLSSQISAAPQRVRVGDRWEQLDTTLHAGDGARVAPRHSPVSLSFSPGGDRDLVSLGRHGRSVALRWPAPLPKPVIDGDAARYPDALPGADLQVAATSAGYDLVLIVKTAEAYASRAVRELPLEYTAAGLTVRKDADGRIVASDPDGRVVFEGNGSGLWDSAGSAGSARRAGTGRHTPLTDPDHAAGPGGGDNVGHLQVDVAGSDRLTVAPHGDWRAVSPVFPVFLRPDLPTVSGEILRWNYVMSDHPNSSYSQFAKTAGVGRCHYTAGIYCDPRRPGADFVSRIYARFESSTGAAVWKKRTIDKVKLSAYETFAFKCDKRDVDLRQVTAKYVKKGMTWNSKPPAGNFLKRQKVSYGRDCPHHKGPAWVVFQKSKRLRTAVLNAFRQGTTVAFSLTARDEDDGISWKRFRGDNIRLHITYNTTPDAPAKLAGRNPTLPCASGDSRPWLTRDSVTLTARHHDDDRIHKVQTTFDVVDAATGKSAYSGSTAWLSSQGTSTVTVPPNTLGHGGIYRWRARSTDGVRASAYSDWCEFQVDTEPPSPPLLSSDDVGEGKPSKPAGQPVTFQVSRGPGGDSVFGDDVVRYAWAVNDDLPRDEVPAVAGKTDVRVAPASFGPNRLYAVAIDRAGNRSDLPEPLPFTTSRTCPDLASDACTAATYRLDEVSGATATDTSPNRQHLTLTGATWDKGSSAHQTDGGLRFSGSAHAEGPTMFDHGNHFTIMARVRLERLDRDAAVMSFPGATQSALSVEYSARTRQWSARVESADAGASTATVALGGVSPAAGEWVHVAVTFDALARRLLLYVNGEQAASAYTSGSAWRATTPTLQLGRTRLAGQWARHLPGVLDDVRLYQGEIDSGLIKLLARGDS